MKTLSEYEMFISELRIKYMKDTSHNDGDKVGGSNEQ